MAGEVTDPRVKAILLGGGAMAAGAPFVAGAMSGSQRPIDRARASRIARAAPASRGVLGTLGRFSGPVGAAAGMLMPSQLGDGTLQGNEQMLDPTLNRSMFGGQPPQAAGTGITSGLETTPEQEAEMEGTLSELAGGLQSMNDDIDNAEDYVGIMNAIRGDDQSIEQRRSELAGYIGKDDAGKTPESALTLIQPSLTLLDSADQGSQEEGGAIADDGIMSMLGELGGQGAMQGAADAMQGGQPMQAPGQGEAMARMAMGEQPVRMNLGGLGSDAKADMSAYTKGTNPYPITDLTKTLPVNSDNLSMLQALLGDIPKAKTTAELLPQYQELYKDSGKAYELNPYIAGLQLASAVANAPKGGLLTSILAPETIKAVSDPILQMAQAKGQGDLLAKKAAMEAASSSRDKETAARQAYTVAAIPKLMDGSFSIVGGEGGRYLLNSQTGAYSSIDGSVKYDAITLSDGRTALYNPREPSDVQYLGDKKGTNKFDLKPVLGGALVFNKETGHTDYRPIDNMPIDYTVHGNAENGFFKMDKAGNVTPLGEDQTGIKPGFKPTDLQKNISALNDARSTLRRMIDENVSPTNQDYINAKNTVETLAAELTPMKGSEFERLMNERAKGIYETTAGSAAAKQKAVDAFRMKSIDGYITAKNTVNLQYNPNQAVDKEFAELFGSQIKGIQEGAASAQALAGLSEQATIASERFQTGAFAETRLSLLKMADAIGGRDRLKSLMGESSYNSVFDPANNDVPSGELLRSVGSRFAVMLAEAFPGNLNQSEVDLIKTAGSNIGVSRAGLKVLQRAFEKASARAAQEQEYATAFNLDPANKNLGAKELYAKFNQGLNEIRANNAVITQEDISGAEADATAAQAGGLQLQDTSGNEFNLTATDALMFEQVKKYPDKASFLADWPNIKSTNPSIANHDASAAFDMLFPLSRKP